MGDQPAHREVIHARGQGGSSKPCSSGRRIATCPRLFGKQLFY